MSREISSRLSCRENFAAAIHRHFDSLGVPARGRAARLAEVLGVTHTAALKWLNGVSLPEVDRQRIIAAWCGMVLDDMLSGAVEMPSSEKVCSWPVSSELVMIEGTSSGMCLSSMLMSRLGLLSDQPDDFAVHSVSTSAIEGIAAGAYCVVRRNIRALDVDSATYLIRYLPADNYLLRRIAVLPDGQVSISADHMAIAPISLPIGQIRFWSKLLSPDVAAAAGVLVYGRVEVVLSRFNN